MEVTEGAFRVIAIRESSQSTLFFGEDEQMKNAVIATDRIARWALCGPRHL
jgi:hypothetical protein